MIDGVKIKNLKVIPDERGRLMEILRSDDELFAKFGQVYMTTTYPGVVKAWHYHKIQTDNVAAIKGMIKLVLYDDRKGSKTKGEVNEFIISTDNPMLVTIPNDIMHGFEAVGGEEAIVINTPTNTYDRQSPDEFRTDPFNNHIPYQWEAKKGG